jgi:hypothetical protein
MKQTTIIITFFTLLTVTSLWFNYTLLTENKQLKQEVSMYSAKWRSTRLQEEVIRLLNQDTAIARYEANRIIYNKKAMENGYVWLFAQPYDRRGFSREARVAAQAYKDSIIGLKYK